MNFIKKIFDRKIDGLVHLQFQKFSRGEFYDRAVIRAKKTVGKYSISTTYEFANELVRIVAEKLGERKTQVVGAIVSTQDLSNEINFKDKKQFQGVKRYLVDQEMTGEEILKLLNYSPKAFFGLSFECEDTKLKVKPKAPKSGKPGSNKEEAPKSDFCKLITPDKSLAKSFVFECDDFKEAEIKHIFKIESIVIPDELRNSKDFAKVREESKRKGKIVRIAKIDGKETKKEVDFEA